MVHGAILSFVISDEGQPVDKKGKPLNYYLHMKMEKPTIIVL